MITQREISRKAFQARKQDRVVEKDYVITWLLLGISDSTLRNILAFKGGTALKKAYFEDYRFSEDLDFTVLSNLEVDRLLELLSEIFSSLAGEVALMFRTDDRKIEARADSLSLPLVSAILTLDRDLVPHRRGRSEAVVTRRQVHLNPYSQEERPPEGGRSFLLVGYQL